MQGLSVTLQLGSDTSTRRVLEISRLDGFFASADSREEAIALARCSRVVLAATSTEDPSPLVADSASAQRRSKGVDAIT